jgi:serine/threonine protein kinase
MTESLAALRGALAGRYRVDRVLGRGGMATVYLAEDLSGRGQVAIKVLRPELKAILGATRFRREIEILTRLHHPNILPLLDTQEAGNMLYYVMPYVTGDSLRALLEREGPLSIERTLAITRDVAAALDYAHSHNVVHRDIKPGNVLLERDRALVCDFGVSRALLQASTEPISSSGLVVGTAAYMSPEQAMGRGGVDARTDIYALGCVIYEMLTGEQPFSGPTSQAIIARKISGKPRAIRTVRPEVAGAMEQAILEALAKEPEARPRSGEQLMQAMTATRTRL